MYDDRDDLGEQIRSTVAASTDWINDLIEDVKAGMAVESNYRRNPQLDPELVKRRHEEQARRQQELAEKVKQKQIQRSKFGPIPDGKAILNWIGEFVFGSWGVFFGIATIIMLFGLNIAATVILGGLTALFYSLFDKNRRSRKQIKRMKEMLEYLKDKEYIEIEQLERYFERPKRIIIRDLKKMISSRVLKQGHIDDQEKYLFITDEMFNQYQASVRGYVERTKVEEEKTAEQELREQAEQAKSELTETLEQGRDYIRQIRLANNQIPGEEITAKLDRLELIAEQIFKIVEEHPEKLPELHKFMEYYLPTTLKLVNSYYEFDRQPVQGENIISAKAEIEGTLDMINLAFENLSNRLYQDVAMDVSTDISVLQTMLAQEGLNSEDFKLK